MVILKLPLPLLLQYLRLAFLLFHSSILHSLFSYNSPLRLKCQNPNRPVWSKQKTLKCLNYQFQELLKLICPGNLRPTFRLTRAARRPRQWVSGRWVGAPRDWPGALSCRSNTYAQMGL